MKPEILLIDDEKVILMLHKTLMIKLGFDPAPKTFTDPKNALDYIFENKGNDVNFLIFLDIYMPEFKSWNFIEQLKTHKEKINFQVIIVSSSINIMDKEKAKEYEEIVSFLEKPLKEIDLQSLLEVGKLKIND